MEEIKETVMVEVVDIQFRPGQKVYFFAPGDLRLQAGDHVIMDTARGPEYGIVTAGNHRIPEKDVVSPLRSVMRRATAQDERTVEENREKEKKAFNVCMQKIEEQALDMQLVSAEVAFDGSKILFFFTADERVDFRELVKTLASTFRTRIELRQIGVRDKAKMVGGLGICGRPFCCASFLDDFQPVSIKMAKTQNLSLNPTKISGTCGRLMCCLKYEQDAYEDLIRTSPKAESFVDTPEGRGTVTEIDLLRQRVKVRLEEHPEEIRVFQNTEIAVLRNGKAKKNDPPVPADLAPISGGGKRVRKEPEEQDAPRFLDPIRFRYSTETIVEEDPQPVPETAPAEEKEEHRSQSRRRRRSKGPAKDTQKETPKETPKEAPKAKEVPKPKQEKKPAKPKTETPKEPAAEGEAKPVKPRRRPNYRRRPSKPKTGEGNGNA